MSLLFYKLSQGGLNTPSNKLKVTDYTVCTWKTTFCNFGVQGKMQSLFPFSRAQRCCHEVARGRDSFHSFLKWTLGSLCCMKSSDFLPNAELHEPLPLLSDLHFVALLHGYHWGLIYISIPADFTCTPGSFFQSFNVPKQRKMADEEIDTNNPNLLQSNPPLAIVKLMPWILIGNISIISTLKIKDYWF